MNRNISFRGTELEYAHGHAAIHLQSDMREVRSGVLAADMDAEWQDDQGMLLFRWYLLFIPQGKACTFDDDFNTIAPAILEADAIVFTMPVYWYSIPAQIKGVIDRIFSLVVGGKDIAGKECALITCCEEEDMSVMDG